MVHNHDHNYNSSKNIGVAFVLNLSFTILEIFGGLWTNSVAILSDAVHDLGDAISLGLAWYLDRYSKKEADSKYTFGYARFSLLGAVITTTVLIIGSVIVLRRAIPRIINPEPSSAQGMLVFAIIGIVINGLAVLRLRGGKSMNEKVVSWHFLEDVLGWIAILIVSIVLFFKDIYILDPILSVIITVYVLFNVIKNLRKILRILLQRVPEDLEVEDLQQKINNLEGINDVHHTHLWTLDGENNLLSTHIVVESNIDKKGQIKLKEKIRELMEKNNVGHVTIEIDFNDEICDDPDC